jgi:hypothetical protein
MKVTVLVAAQVTAVQMAAVQVTAAQMAAAQVTAVQMAAVQVTAAQMAAVQMAPVRVARAAVLALQMRVILVRPKWVSFWEMKRVRLFWSCLQVQRGALIAAESASQQRSLRALKLAG